MRKIIIVIMAALLLMLSASFVSAQESEGSKIIAGFNYPDIKWSVPEVGKEVRREVLDNGIILYMMKDDRLPLFNISALFRCGEIYYPLEKMAVADMTGEMMRRGGTTNIAPDSLNTLLESIGASLETYIGTESGSATLRVMSKDTELGIEMLNDVLRNPAFPEDQLDLVKAESKNSIKRRNDRPAGILTRHFYNLLYGDHPDGRVLEWEYVKSVTRQDMIDCHSKYFAPNNLMLGITGDFDPDQIIGLLNKYMGDWKSAEIDFPEMPKVADNPKPGVYQIFKDINQTNIRIGHLGINRDNPDRYAINVMNYILGGGSFTSRMTTKVRSDEGLAYSVGSRYQTSNRDLGAFYAYCQTKASTTHFAMELMMAEVNRIRDEKVDDEELESAKDSYINRYVFNFTSASQIVGQLMRLEFNDRPRDLLKQYIGNILAVTKDDILRVAKKYLDPEKLSFVVVGNPASFDKPLDDFGTITNIELEDPVLE